MMTNDAATAAKVDEETFAPTREPQVSPNRATNRPIIAPKLHHTTFTGSSRFEVRVWR